MENDRDSHADEAILAFMDAQTLGRRLVPAVIAIDGPAASGKSSIGFAVAALLDFLFFDTGIMYRAVTRAMLDRQVDVNDESGIARLAEAIHIDLASPAPDVTDGRQCTVLLDGEDVTWSIRAPEVDRNVSAVSAYPGVRAAMTRQQRRIGERYGTGQADRAGIIMVGRDVGTVVMPHAAVKFYMDASVGERARRRFTELHERGKSVEYADVYQDILRRDAIDSQRDLAPLRAADDAIIIDTTALTPEAVVAQVLSAITAKVGVDDVDT